MADTWAPQRAADLKPATRAFYAAIYGAHIAPTFATVPLRDITPQRVAAWQADRVKAGGGRTAIKQALTLLGGILGYAVELEHLQAKRRTRREARQTPRSEDRACLERPRSRSATGRT